MNAAHFITKAAAWYKTWRCQHIFLSCHFHLSVMDCIIKCIQSYKHFCSNIKHIGCIGFKSSEVPMFPSPLGHVEDRCLLHGPAERQVGSLTVTTSFPLPLLPTTLAHLCLSSVPCANYPAPIVLSWMHPTPMGKRLNTVWHNLHSLLDNLKTWKDCPSLDSRNIFLSCIIGKENTRRWFP